MLAGTGNKKSSVGANYECQPGFLSDKGYQCGFTNGYGRLFVSAKKDGSQWVSFFIFLFSGMLSVTRMQHSFDYAGAQEGYDYPNGNDQNTPAYM